MIALLFIIILVDVLLSFSLCRASARGDAAVRHFVNRQS